MKNKIPRVLLIGAGAFGSKHLQTLLSLEKQGLVKVAGIVVNTEQSRRRLKRQYNLPVFRGFSTKLLDQVDMVDITTPVETHFELVSQCLPLVHVFVEKPLAKDIKETNILKKQAAAAKHVLMVGHIFRFHPVILKLKELLKTIKQRPQAIEASFLNSIDTDNGREVELEMLHPFDMVDQLFGKTPLQKHVDDKGRFKIVSLVYSGGIKAVLKLGWLGQEKVRTLNILFKNQRIVCDLNKNKIDIYEKGSLKRSIDCQHSQSPLEAELCTFLSCHTSAKVTYPDAAVGHRIVSVATMGQAGLPKISRKKKIAIIGAGIFGTNCAIELSPQYDVTLFEKNTSILSEASHLNQYRHHWGYHYPRSQETINDIRLAADDFEQRYQQAIIREFPTYYSVAKADSKVTPQQYLDFCDRNNLDYTIEDPHPSFLDKTKIDLCLKTYEPIYDYTKLKSITLKLLRQSRAKVLLNQEIIGAHLAKNGQKVLTIKKGDITREESFDYVINVTYARYNTFCQWLGFHRKPIRIDLVETLWVKLNIPKISLAVMDGNFTNMVPTGQPGVFTLVHIKDSVRRRFVPKDGLVPKDIFAQTNNSNVKNILKKSIDWFPIIKEAKLLSTHYVLRGVNAYREHDDSRTSDISEHGFGCFSILGGKIINSVSVAKKINQHIAG